MIPRQYLWLGCVLLLPLQAVHADISGKVFRDFNANGAFDTGAGVNETGMEGVTVKAFAADDASSSPTATTTSGADGAYTLNGLLAEAGGGWRNFCAVC